MSWLRWTPTAPSSVVVVHAASIMAAAAGCGAADDVAFMDASSPSRYLELGHFVPGRLK